MGKPTGFLEWQRLLPKKRAVTDRLKDWREVEAPHGPLENDLTRAQAGRCMDCGVPFCTQGCPLGNPIPDFADAVWKERWKDAHKRLAATNDFPEFTGRLCPAPCEGSCVLGIDGQPVTIEAIEKEIAEAEKAAREEAKKKQKVVGNGGKKVADSAATTQPPTAPKSEPAAPQMLSLFDQQSQTDANKPAEEAPQTGANPQ